MDIAKKLDSLEDKYYDSWEEDRAKLVAELKPLHQQLASEDPDAFREFKFRVINHFGGAYIPYIFWSELNTFIDEPIDARVFLQESLKSFANSDFGDIEQQKLKPLLVTYFNMEKEFEMNKFFSQVISKTHPSVKEYFRTMQTFHEKNGKATEVYKQKFLLVKSFFPDFELINQPLSHLRESLSK
jgi:hypothetical protein